MTKLKQISFVILTFLSGYAVADGDQKITWDLGAASGRYRLSGPPVQDISYSEIQVGLNYFLIDWLSARAMGFVRFPSATGTVEGMDLGLRAHESLDFGSNSGLSAFAGSGYRFVTKGGNAPYGEAGVVFKLGGLSVGGGAKVTFNNWVKNQAENDIQYFLILSGGGTL